MDRCKPTITCHGDQELFASLRSELSERLPRETVEWRRSYGRPPKNVIVDVNYVAFSSDSLPKEKERTLLKQPFFHIYWTTCPDADTYKSELKDDIASWLHTLKQHNITDWYIVLVETDNIKNKPKLLPRMSVIDKIRSDFCSKQSDRCIVLFQSSLPAAAGRSIESWQIMISKIRPLILSSYNKNLGKFEEMMRSQREKRTEPGWNFCEYFMLQEELAFVFEMLKLPEESLVQYDELDALFSQFVINTQAGESPKWLSSFTGQCDNWDGLNLSQPIDEEKRKLIQQGKSATLLDLRNYLFSRQCALLFSLQRPWEVAQRSLPFMHNTVHELHILEVPMPVGSVACWVFLSCLEVLQMCERCGNASQVDVYTHYTASLWAYARDKLLELGLLCGLMPDMTPLSEQLHLVVNLLSGMGQSGLTENSPNQKLREALSSKESFHKHYLELSELAMGTYKHIGRLRCAKRIGKDLANFYMKNGEANKAELFLSDALKTYVEEGWDLLASYTRKQLAECQKQVDVTGKYVKNCALLASDGHLKTEDRNQFCNELVKCSAQLISNSEAEMEVVMKMDPVLILHDVSMNPDSGKLIPGQDVVFSFTIHSNLPKDILCNKLSLSLIHVSHDDDSQSEDRVSHDSGDQSSEKPSQSQSVQQSFARNIAPVIDLRHECDYAPDKSIQWSAVVCRNTTTLLQRQDSTSSLRRVDIWQKEDFSMAVIKDNVTLHPGMNTVDLKTQVKDQGKFILNQLCLEINGLELLHPKIQPMMSYYVTTKEPAISLCPSQEPLYAGVPQWLCLQLCTDNVPVKSGDVMKIKTPQSTCIMKSSTDLYHINPTEYGGVLYLPDIPANSQMDVEIQLMAAMPDSKENVEQLINSQLDFDCPWSEEITCDLNFQLPFTTNHHLHTAGLRKFIQLKIESLSDLEFSLQEPVLSITTVTGDSVKATAMHKNTDMQLMHNTPISYVWTLDSTMENGHLDCKFEVNYKLLQEETNSTMQRCCHAFSLHSHQTEYVIESEVKAQSTSNCKAGTLCNLHFHITQVHDVSTNVKNTLLYEIVSSASLWAVCGKSSGVFTLPAVADASHDINLEVMPLIAGYIPVPSMKLSRYLSEDTPLTDNAIQEAEPQDCKMNNDDTNKPQLEEFGVGQIYNISRTVQVHVMPESNTSTVEVSVPQ